MFVNLLLIVVSFFHFGHSLSVCEEIEITIFIDTDFIKYSYKNVSKLISGIISEGSSEYSSLSIYLYGKSVPKESFKVINSLDTYKILRRDKLQHHIIQSLNKAQHDIVGTEQTVEILLIKAFSEAINDEMPVRSFKKRHFLKKTGRKVGKIGMNDGNRVFLVLDYNNDFDNSQFKCDIISYFENRESENFFIISPFGTQEKMKQVKLCDNEITIPIFTLQGIMSSKRLFEAVLDITCPANIISEDYGDVNLNSRISLVPDVDIIVECHEVFTNEIQNQLNDFFSYIIVKDYYDDDMSFSIDHFILFDKDTYLNYILYSNLGCSHPLYKISQISVINTQDNYQILKLSILLPQSPSEYMLESNISARNANFSTDNNNQDLNSRRMWDWISESATNYRFNNTIFGFPFDYSIDKKWGNKGNITYSNDFLTAIGIGSINITYGTSLVVDVLIDFDFKWSGIFDQEVKIYYKLHGYYQVSAYFNVRIDGEIKIDFNLWDYAISGQFIWIGYLPIYIRPYLELNATLQSLPLEIWGGISCTYKQEYETGYYYNYYETLSPVYGLIDTNTAYTFNNTAVWTAEDGGVDTLEDCVRAAYQYDDSSGEICEWFQWNEENKICKCKGNTGLYGNTKYEFGTTAYVMNYECHELENSCGIGPIGACLSDSAVRCTTDCDSLVWSCWDCRDCDFWESSPVSNWATEEYSINSTTVVEKSCKINWGIGNPNSCNKTEFGFDVIITPKIGSFLYEIINVYLKLDVTFPFRLDIPNLDTTTCNDYNNGNNCFLSFYFSSYIDLYVGIDVKFDTLIETVTEYVFGSGIESPIQLPNYANESQIINKYPILNKTYIISCLNFTAGGLWDTLINLLDKSCCAVPSTTPTKSPSFLPSSTPSFLPSDLPSLIPSNLPTLAPSFLSTHLPSQIPSYIPSEGPSASPSSNPLKNPSVTPNVLPSLAPTINPSGSLVGNLTNHTDFPSEINFFPRTTTFSIEGGQRNDSNNNSNNGNLGIILGIIVPGIIILIVVAFVFYKFYWNSDKNNKSKENNFSDENQEGQDLIQNTQNTKEENINVEEHV